MNYFEELFKKLRHTKAHHLGLGDIRLTVAQQDEIVGITNEMNEQADLMIAKIDAKEATSKELLEALREAPTVFAYELRQALSEGLDYQSAVACGRDALRDHCDEALRKAGKDV